MSELQERRFGPMHAAAAAAGSLKGLLHLRLPLPSLPNPLLWVPRPRLSRGRRSKSQFAATTLSISQGLLTVSPLPPAKAVAKPALKPISDVLAGALARAASQSTIHPLDTLKVRLQANRPNIKPIGLSKIAQLVPPPPGVLPPRFDPSALGATVANLYKGVVGAASGAGIAIGAYFAIYGVATNAISRHTDLSAPSVAFVSGAIAAAGSSVVKVPLAVCIRSVQAGVYPNFAVAARSIVAAAGVRGLFTGYVPTVMEDMPDMAIKFAVYESLRSLHQKVTNGRRATVSEDFAMGAFAGAAAAAATTPLDVIKTNMMCNAASRPTMAGVMSGVMARGGPAAFFRGVGARSLSNGINSAVFFCFFETLRVQMATAKQRLETSNIVVGRGGSSGGGATSGTVQAPGRR